MAQITDPELLQAALAGYQQQLSEIEQKMAELRKRIGGRAPASAAVPAPKQSRLSPEARARIAAAQRRRWAKAKAAKKAAPVKKAAPAKKAKAKATGSAEAPAES